MTGRKIGTISLVVFCAAAFIEAASIDEILEYRSLGEVVAAPDGRWAALVATRANFESNVLDSNIWVVDLETGEASQLTFASKRDWHPRFSPDGRELAFLSDRDGTTTIWKMRVARGEAAKLFDAAGDVEAFEWLPDGSGWIFTMRDAKDEDEDIVEVDKTFRFARLYRLTAHGGEPELLTEDAVHVNSFDVASDATWMALSVQPTPKVPDGRLHSDLKILDLETKALRDLVRRPGLDRAPRIAPDGGSVAFITMNGKADWIGNHGVSVVSRDGSALRNVSPSLDERVLEPLRWSRDGRFVYALANERTARRLFAIDVESTSSEAVTDSDRFKVVSSFALLEEGKLLVTASDAHTPEELFEIGAGARKLTALNAAYDAASVGRTEVMTYERDGLGLEGLLVKPVGFEEGRAYPLLLVIHGGPSGVFNLAFSPRRGAYPIHAFSEAGYLVFMPNPRGSGGYGDAFRRSNFKGWGFGDFEDIIAGVDLLIDRGLVDASRMGVMGWSYGGFMTSWTVTHTDRFKAASIGAPVTNPYSFYGVTDIPDFTEAYFGGKPWGDDVDYLRHAPEHFAQNAKTPSLIQHGEEDVRVPLSQGTAFYRALKLNGVNVEMVIYPREPHGFREPKHIRDAMERNLQWFEHWLSDGGPTSEP